MHQLHIVYIMFVYTVYIGVYCMYILWTVGYRDGENPDVIQSTEIAQERMRNLWLVCCNILYVIIT